MLYLSNDVSFTYFWLLNRELQVVKVLYIFWDILYGFDKDQATENYYAMVKTFLIQLFILR